MKSLRNYIQEFSTRNILFQEEKKYSNYKDKEFCSLVKSFLDTEDSCGLIDTIYLPIRSTLQLQERLKELKGYNSYTNILDSSATKWDFVRFLFEDLHEIPFTYRGSSDFKELTTLTNCLIDSEFSFTPNPLYDSIFVTNSQWVYFENNLLKSFPQDFNEEGGFPSLSLENIFQLQGSLYFLPLENLFQLLSEGLETDTSFYNSLEDLINPLGNFEHLSEGNDTQVFLKRLEEYLDKGDSSYFAIPAKDLLLSDFLEGIFANKHLVKSSLSVKIAERLKEIDGSQMVPKDLLLEVFQLANSNNTNASVPSVEKLTHFTPINRYENVLSAFLKNLKTLLEGFEVRPSKETFFIEPLEKDSPFPSSKFKIKTTRKSLPLVTLESLEEWEREHGELDSFLKSSWTHELKRIYSKEHGTDNLQKLIGDEMDNLNSGTLLSVLEAFRDKDGIPLTDFFLDQITQSFNEKTVVDETLFGEVFQLILDNEKHLDENLLLIVTTEASDRLRLESYLKSVRAQIAQNRFRRVIDPERISRLERLPGFDGCYEMLDAEQLSNWLDNNEDQYGSSFELVQTFVNYLIRILEESPVSFVPSPPFLPLMEKWKSAKSLIDSSFSSFPTYDHPLEDMDEDILVKYLLFVYDKIVEVVEKDTAKCPSELVEEIDSPDIDTVRSFKFKNIASAKPKSKTKTSSADKAFLQRVVTEGFSEDPEPVAVIQPQVVHTKIGLPKNQMISILNSLIDKGLLDVKIPRVSSGGISEKNTYYSLEVSGVQQDGDTFYLEFESKQTSEKSEEDMDPAELGNVLWSKDPDVSSVFSVPSPSDNRDFTPDELADFILSLGSPTSGITNE